MGESLYIRLHDFTGGKARGWKVLISPQDVPASRFIEKVAKYLKENIDEVTPPPWANTVKTGVHAQRPPEDPDWWFIRCASLLRKTYLHGPVGVERLRAEYGGRKDYGVRPEHASKAGGSIVRKALQQLEAAGFVETFRARGRKVTKKGRRLLEELAADVKKETVKETPELEKY